jgi:hypothetical protein
LLDHMLYLHLKVPFTDSCYFGPTAIQAYLSRRD